jgi:hypothetical protein
MTDLAALFDSYGRKARLYPSLLAVLAPLVTVLAWVPVLMTGTAGASIVGITAGCGLLYALSVFARRAGKRVEKRLLAAWGGWPTTLMLRHRQSALPKPTLQRYHHYLAEGAQLKIPSLEKEARDPLGSDAVYASAVQWLKEQRRGDDHALVHRENAEYGFRRNLLGLKRVAIILCVVSIVVSAVLISLSEGGSRPFDVSAAGLQRLWMLAAPVVWAATILNAILLAGWIIVVTDDWVREAGDQYAVALLATCDSPSKVTVQPATSTLTVR